MIRLLAALAIVGGTIHTGRGPALENATVLIDGDRIVAVGPDVDVPRDAFVIDARESQITPGFVHVGSRLGVEEVALESSSVEATLPPASDPVRAALRVADTFDTHTLVLPESRIAGITSAVVVPIGGVVSGLALWADLADPANIVRRDVALRLAIEGSAQEGSRAAAFLRLREVFEDARLYRENRGPYLTRRLRDLSASHQDLQVLERALSRELPVLFEVNRASDIQTALEITRDYRLRAILTGVAEGWIVAGEIARSGVPVVVDPLDTLPRNFDRLRSRRDLAARMHRAGVTVAFTCRDPFVRAPRLRLAAGNAVAEGFPYSNALAAISRVPAEILGRSDAGEIRPGAVANIVVWNGDPLEPSSWPVHVLVRGRETDLRSRPDLLTERYLSRR